MFWVHVRRIPTLQSPSETVLTFLTLDIVGHQSPAWVRITLREQELVWLWKDSSMLSGDAGVLQPVIFCQMTCFFSTPLLVKLLLERMRTNPNSRWVSKENGIGRFQPKSNSTSRHPEVFATRRPWTLKDLPVWYLTVRFQWYIFVFPTSFKLFFRFSYHTSKR